MNSDEQLNRRNDADQVDGGDEGGADLPSSTIIGTNVVGLNTSPYPGGIVAPAAELAAEDARDKGGDSAETDTLGQLGSEYRQTGDEGVSAGQGELEAGELNG